MRKILNKLPRLALLCLLVYIVFAFSQLNFDVRIWSEEIRGLCAFVMGIVAFIVTALEEL